MDTENDNKEKCLFPQACVKAWGDKPEGNPQGG